MAKKLERELKKRVKKLHPLTKAAVAVALLVGILVGAFVCLQFSKEDRFVLKGETAFALDVGAEGSVYVYEEKGLEAYCFGLDVSGKCTVETDLEKDAEGRYVVPTDKEGVYTITYTVDALKFGDKAPNGVIKRIRVFTVTASEEDGRNG